MKKAAKAKKNITLENIAKSIDILAHATAKGFASNEQQFDSVKSILKTMNLRIDGFEGDIRDLKNSVGPVIRMSAMQDKEISDLKHRVSRLERLSR